MRTASGPARFAGPGYHAQVRTELYGGPPGELAREWEELYRSDPCATPFVSPGWGLAWMRHLGRGAHPWLITVRVDDRLVGLAPLALERRRGMRVVRLLGKEPGDYWDVLSLPEHRNEVAVAVARELSRLEDRWDVFFLDGQPGDSATGALGGHRSLRVRPRAPTPCPLIDLPDDFDEYLSLLPSSHRGNIRRHLRRLDRGDVMLREVTDLGELDAAIARWHELHLKRWEGLAERIDPTHLTRNFREFVLDAMRALVPRDLATVWEFCAAGEVVGVYVNLIDENAFYWYLGGFEPSCARLGIGKMSIGHGIRWSIETGRRYFDLTRGEESFKYYFGASDRHCPSVVVGNERLRSRAAFAASDVRDRLGRSVRSARLRLRERGSARPGLAVIAAESAGDRKDTQPAGYRERVSVGPR
jgi:CelD/BcsL family acetyltransferase involved in cellulose biosynthesis